MGTRSSHTGSSFFVGVSSVKTLQRPSLVLVKPRKDMNNVSCRRDITFSQPWTPRKFSKSENFGPCQPARNAQADMSRYFS